MTDNMTAPTSSTSFAYVIGTLINFPRLRQEGVTAVFTLQQPDASQVFIRVNNLARVEMVMSWSVGDFIVVTGHLKSHYDTKMRRQMMYVHALNFFRLTAISSAAWEELSRELWKELGLPSFLSMAGVFLKLASEEEVDYWTTDK